jgi:hypothetical protein
MKLKFREVKLSKDNKFRLIKINEIIEEYKAGGYVLTLRQLYYQLVSRDIIPNKQAEYAKLSTLLKEGRMGGIVDWDAIEDRLRRPSTPPSWDSPQDIMESVINQYQKPRMKGQKRYVEVWVEKDALSGVLKRVTSKYHVPILVNRGYSSVSAMYDSYNRFIRAIKEGQSITIIYLGDYDPSGIDMIRDIKDRISEFLCSSKPILEKFKELVDSEDADDNETANEYINPYYNQGLDTWECLDLAASDWAEQYVKDNFRVVAVALTRAQIDTYNPPPNPAKKSDPRAKDFIKKHGGQSWEVDALKPEILNKILEDSITSMIDVKLYKNVCSSEKKDVDKLKELTKQL